MGQTEQLGRVGYAAYAECTGGKTYDGREMPEWDALPERIRGAWVRAAQAIVGEAMGVRPLQIWVNDEALAPIDGDPPEIVSDDGVELPEMVFAFGDGAFPELRGRSLHRVRRAKVGLLRGGMVGGRSSVTMVLHLPDRKAVFFETSLRMFVAAASALVAREQFEIEVEGDAEKAKVSDG